MLRKILGGSFLVAGTTVGAGMLGIPLLTAQAGFWPGVIVTLFAWAIMLWTGLLFMEATLWMPLGSNLLSMSKRFFGNKGQLFSGVMFIFLYYCLLVAYFAAGAPMLASSVGLAGQSIQSYAFFGLIFALIIGLGAKWIDRTNLMLTAGLIASYIVLMGVGIPFIDAQKLTNFDGKAAFFALPILFAAFGFHNIVPSLSAYFHKERKPLKLSIIFGTIIALIIYLIWQWLVLGIIPQGSIQEALLQGRPVTAALQGVTGNAWLFKIGQAFAFFALSTSLLGVSFSMVDFLADGFQMQKEGWKRGVLAFATFFPPFVLVTIYPAIFEKALGIAGGIGEAILNGLIPIALFWVGSKHLELKQRPHVGSKIALASLGAVILGVMIIEVLNLLSST